MEMMEIDSVKGKRLWIKEDVARSGFGVLKNAEYDGNPCLVKWFSKKELARTGCGKQIYQNICDHLEQEPLGKQFFWPIDVVKTGGETFGYVAGSGLSSYVSLADLMEERAYYENWSAVVNAALCLVTAFFQMRKRTYYLLHMTEDDIFINPGTGQILITNTEFARVNANNSMAASDAGQNCIACASRFLSPDSYLDNGSFAKLSNDHMLAVLLFEILFLHHPLEGYRAASYPVMDESAKKMVYGEQPCFVYDAENKSNRPVRGIHINLIRRWELYPDYVRKSFISTFRQEVLSGAEPYVSIEKWFYLFLKLRSQIVSCMSCGTENIWKTGDQKCRRCKKPLMQPSLYYHIERKCYPVFLGSCIYQCQLNLNINLVQNEFYMVAAGKFVRAKNNSSVCLLQNISGDQWTVIDSRGIENVLASQETVMLEDGMKVVADGKTIIIRSKNT